MVALPGFRLAMTNGVQLHVHSAFSFLDGASLPEELVQEAATKNIATIALTDSHRLSGIVTFLKAAQASGLKAIAGATIKLPGEGQLVLLVPDTAHLPQLTRLLTHAHRDHPRGSPQVEWEMLRRWGPGLVALSGGRRGVLDRLIYAGQQAAALEQAQKLQGIFGPDFYLEVGAGWLPGDRSIRAALKSLGQHLGLSLIASSEVRHAEREDFPVYDLMVAIRHGLRVEEPHPDRPLNRELYLKDRDSMRRALGDLGPEALKTADRLAEKLTTPEILGRSRVPQLDPNPETAWQRLQQLVWEGARRRYREHWKAVRPRIGHELGIIRDLGFVDYFLVVEDVARFARQAGIRFAGRGSAADSAVAYCLGITEVDAVARELLFERFLSRERAETPDIDIDFDARRRDEVAQYVIERYGRERVAAVATYQTFRARLAIRQIGRVMGFPARELDVLAKSLPPLSLEDMVQHFDDIPELRVLGLTPASRQILAWAAKVEGRPRHIGTHLGGLVISGDPLELVTPLERSAKGVEICQFDKRDVEALGLLKLDLLSLRTFTAVDMAVRSITETTPAFRYEDIPPEDPAVYRRLQEADSIGVFQLESPAQRALARRLQPDRYEDIVASLALIRPGPIKGNMVTPFVDRRRGWEPVEYLHPDLEPILHKTYGVVLFQEQVIAIASALAGFTPGEADQLRRVMTHARSPKEMERLGQQFQLKATARGIAPEVSAAVFAQMVGYASYGFNEAHAAAFADTAYRTTYLLEHYPGPYYTGLLNAQPMGFYPVDLLVTEARRRGINIAPLDINTSGAEYRWIPKRQAIQTGLQAVSGLGADNACQLLAARQEKPFQHPGDVLRRTPLHRDQVALLVRVGAFDAVDPDRERWLESLLGENPLGLVPSQPGVPWTIWQRLFWEYRILGFGQTAQALHPWRETLRNQGFITCQEALAAPPGSVVRVAGVPVRPHRPPTRSGRLMVFYTLLDETGVLDASLDEAGYRRVGHWLFSGDRPGILACSGRMERSTMTTSGMTAWPPRV